MNHESPGQRRFRVLLRDFGYRVEGRTIIQNGIRGYAEPRIWGTCNSLTDAADQLCPIIHDPDFTNRYVELQRAALR